MTDVILCLSVYRYRHCFDWSVVPTNQCLVLAEINRCQIRDWIVGK